MGRVRVPVVSEMFTQAMFPGSLVTVPPARLESTVAEGERLLRLEARVPGARGPLAVVHRPGPAGTKRQTLFFYGNGMTLLDTPTIRRVLGSEGAGVTCVDYPGYGGTAGKPSEAGCHRAATATLDLVEQELGGEAGEVDVVGWSMGSAVALALAARRPVRRLVLLSPFTGVTPWVMGRMPGPSLRGGALDRVGPFAPPRLDHLEAPTLLVSGTADTVTPHSMATDLKVRLGRAAELMKIEGAGHDLFSRREVWRRVLDFLT